MKKIKFLTFITIIIITVGSCDDSRKDLNQVAIFKSKSFNITIDNKKLSKIIGKASKILHRNEEDFSHIKVVDPNPYDTHAIPFLVLDMKIISDTISCLGIEVHKIFEDNHSIISYYLEANSSVWACWYYNCSGFDFQWVDTRGFIELNDVQCMLCVDSSMNCYGNFFFLSGQQSENFWDFD